jgi:flagellin
VVQTAEGALNEVHSILQRMRDLGVQAGNDSNNTEARANIKTEVDSLTEELTRIGASTNFNGTKLLDGTAGNAGVMKFQVGADGDANSQIEVDLTSANLTTVVSGLGTLSFTDADAAQASITAIDGQIEAISTARASLGASQNRFEHTINSQNVAIENLSASESRIRDTDMAQEMMSFTRSQILTQAGTSMLSQANQSQQGVLSLLR